MHRPTPAPEDLEETRLVLADLARRKLPGLPAELVAAHVVAVCAGADYPVHEAALNALARRRDYAARDGLRVTARPLGPLGPYRTTSATKASHRPYETVLESVFPPRGCCSCADYVSSSLGLCKHLLVALEDVFAKPRRVAAARAAVVPTEPDEPGLVWNPAVPLAGPHDRLRGLSLVGRVTSAALGPSRKAFVDRRLRPEVLASPFERMRGLQRLLARITPDPSSTHGAPAIAASPSAVAVVRAELEVATRLAQTAKQLARLEATFSTLGRKLYPYQRAGVTRALERGRLLLADDMGLGKTTQAIAFCHALFHTRLGRLGILVVPAALKPQWQREWADTTDVPLTVVEGAPGERAALYGAHREGYLLVGYEQLLRDAAEILALPLDVAVADEVQRIKNYATKSAMTVKALTPTYRLALTGTPMENRVDELASILDWIDETALAPKWRLAPFHVVTGAGDGSGNERGGARNLKTLRTRLEGSVLRRVRRDVLTQLPPRTDTHVPVEMTAQQRSEHDDLQPAISSLVARTRHRALTQAEFLRLMSLFTQQRIIANGLGQARFEELWPTYAGARPDEALLDGLFSPKLHELRRLFSDLVVHQGRKVVVFSQWRRMLRLAAWALGDLLEDSHTRALFFTGAERPAQRTQAIVEFHDDPDARVLFLTDAGGVGLNLQRAASACINLELPWNPAVLEQRIGRIYRLGQKKPIDVFNLVSEDSIEGRIAGLVGAKQAVFAGLFDGTSDVVRFDAASTFMGRVRALVDIDGHTPQTSVVSTDGGDEAEAPTLDPSDSLDVGAAPAAPDVVNESAAPSHGARPATAAELTNLFASLRVEHTASGAVRIEAPPEAAATLAAVLEGLAKALLRS